MIGAYNKSYSGDGLGLEGVVYAYQRTTEGFWVNPAEVRPADSQEGDQFGWSVSLHLGNLAVGAPGRPSGAGFGAAFGFVKSGSTWVQVGQVGPLEQDSNRFGEAVAVGAWLACGAPDDDEWIGGTYLTDVGSVLVTEFWSPAP